MQMLVEDCKVSMNISLSEFVPNWIGEISDHLKTHEVYAKAVRIEQYLLKFVPNHFKSQKIWNEAVHMQAYLLESFSSHLKNQEMCKEAMYIKPDSFFFIPKCFKTQENYENVLKWDWRWLKYIPDQYKI